MSLNKIPLDAFLKVLTELFESGVDYIDISEEQGKEGDELKDIIKITVKEEYISMVDEVEFNEEDIIPLSDDDINDLI